MKKKLLRSDVQFAFLLIAILITINHSLFEVEKGISWLSSGYIHYICPICGVTTVYQYFASSADFMTKLMNPVSIFVWGGLIVALIFGPIFCGWICPFGYFQDSVAGRIGKKIFGKRHNNIIPKNVDQALRYLRYVTLGLTVYLVSISAVAFLEEINPYHALLNIFVGEFAPLSLIILGMVFLLALLVDRPWCKYFCPYGALLGMFNIFRIKAIVRDENTCVGCKKCDKTCPMNIEVSNASVVRDHQCISCLECTSDKACPINETVELTGTGQVDEKVAINFKNVAIFIVAIIALGTLSYSITTAQLAYSETDLSGVEITKNLSGSYSSGTYIGEGTGFNSGLVVEVTIENNQIVDLEIISHNETVGYYEEAFITVPTDILSSQSTEVDTVSGATRSSEGIIEAVNNALEQAK